jgi:hypothetical protein
MHCCSHQDREGVGRCVVCGRTLCEECIAEVSGRCCCKGRCEASVKTPEQQQADFLQHMLDFRKIGETLVGQVFRSAKWMSGVLLVITGIALTSSPADASTVANGLLAIGGISLAAYGFMAFSNWKAKKSVVDEA